MAGDQVQLPRSDLARQPNLIGWRGRPDRTLDVCCMIIYQARYLNLVLNFGITKVLTKNYGSLTNKVGIKN